MLVKAVVASYPWCPASFAACASASPFRAPPATGTSIMRAAERAAVDRMERWRLRKQSS